MNSVPKPASQPASSGDPRSGRPSPWGKEAICHDLLRPFRLCARHVRYSPLLLGARRQGVIEASLETLFVEVNRLLGDIGAEYWIAFGTLLGWHRGGRLLRGDVDVDFGLLERDYARTWQARHLLPADFRMYDTTHRHHGPKLYVTWRGWEADIYVYRDGDDVLQSYEKTWRTGDVEPFPRSYVMPRQPATFLGQGTWVPAQPEAWLRHTYGYIGENGVMDRRTGYWRAP